MADANKRTVAVIDGNSLMHRAFHAIMQPMSAPDGRPTNALFGFFNMFIKLVESFKPDGIICAFDKGKPTLRMEMLASYKAQRPPMDENLRPQFPMVKELLRALDVPVCELEGWEGDDILGTLARRGEAQGYEMLLFTGDRDMYQLASENIKIVSTKKGVSEVSIMTPESVDDLYHGITPELVPDFYGLKGDSSDNIPGVPGIGPKKAAALIVEYGSLDEVIAHADEVSGKMGENLRAHIQDALVSREVARIRCDAPIELDLDDARFPTFDPAQVRAAFSALGFRGMIARLERLGSTEGAESPSAQAFVLPEIKEGTAAREALEHCLLDGQHVSVALEVQAPKTGQLSLIPEEDELGFSELWVKTADALLKFCNEDASSALKELFLRGTFASIDVKTLVHVLAPKDSSAELLLDIDEMDPKRFFDVGLAAYLLDSDSNAYEYAPLAETYLSLAVPEPTDELCAPALEALVVEKLVPVLTEALERDGSYELYAHVELPLVLTLARMERAGLLVDPAVLREQALELGASIADMAAAIKAEAGEDFNIDSPMQLSHILFDVMGLPTAGLKKTARGYYSTGAQVLEDLAVRYKIVANVLEYRELAKLKSTYLDALPALIAPDARIHTNLNQKVAATGRLSSSDPNLQNIPTRSELGHRVRKAFVVEEDSVFLTCDYSQIELRLLAHLSGDEHLIAAFREGADFHAATAARVFGVPASEVTPELRARAKAVNFGIVYGQQAFGLASSLKIARQEAQSMIDRYFEAYPGVRAFLDGQVKLAHEKGYVTTLYGRKRHTRDINDRNFQRRAFAERTAMNHPMQGSAADIIKIAMVEVEKRMREANVRSRMVLQIHDELDFEVPKDEIELMSALVRETMEGVVELKVPLIADVSYGPTWAEAK